VFSSFCEAEKRACREQFFTGVQRIHEKYISSSNGGFSAVERGHAVSVSLNLCYSVRATPPNPL
jgi:hypothetical protein